MKLKFYGENMIKDVLYTEGMTYIKDMKEKEITTSNLGFAKSFDLAKNLDVEFYYDNINEEEMMDISRYLTYFIGGCDNRNISDFFNECEELGIRKIIKNDNLFGVVGIQETIQRIINDYNADVALYNIECYGTDNYISATVYKHLHYVSQSSTDIRVHSLLKLVNTDDYDLDKFLKLLKLFNKLEE